MERRVARTRAAMLREDKQQQQQQHRLPHGPPAGYFTAELVMAFVLMAMSLGRWRSYRWSCRGCCCCKWACSPCSTSAPEPNPPVAWRGSPPSCSLVTFPHSVGSPEMIRLRSSAAALTIVGKLRDVVHASLADSFLADLDELSDNEGYPEEDNAEAAGMDEDGDDDMHDLESLNYDDLDSVSKLQKTQRYKDIMQKVEDALQKGTDFSNQGSILEEDPEYQLIVDCNALSVDIENEIIIIHNFIRDKYRLKFPELESLVHHPIDYARVVKKIGNEMDLTLVDLEGLLPSAIIMKVLDFVESRMGYIAPNLSAIVGSAVASKLMGTAGGLGALAKMPACNVQLLGAKRKNLAGFSTATSQFRVGYLEQTEVFQSTPPALRTRACRLIAAKSTLAARVDSIRGDTTGKAGRNLLEEIRKKIEKWQEPPPAKLPKPLPVPDSEPKKKRGGRRLRKMKERYAQTDMMKLANRMQFGIPEESSLGDGLGEGYGMLGQAGSGKLRVSAGQSKLAAKVAKKFKEKRAAVPLQD
nr:unnamed protein product [Digitaria exilis]